jgi:hypothetical protein
MQSNGVNIPRLIMVAIVSLQGTDIVLKGSSHRVVRHEHLEAREEKKPPKNGIARCGPVIEESVLSMEAGSVGSIEERRILDDAQTA